MASIPSPRPLPPEPPGRTLPPTPTRSRPPSPSSPSFAQRRASALAPGRAAGGGRLTRLEPVPESDSRVSIHSETQTQAHIQAKVQTHTQTQAQIEMHAQKPAPLQISGEPVRRRGSAPGLGLGRQRSRYFEHAFGLSTDVVEQEEWVKGHSMVVADLKTNVFIHDEARFITDLAQLLSKRYHRPTACITITLQHGVCMYLSGTFEPAYTLAVHALPSQVQTVTNKRNLMLIQAHLEGALRVTQARGVVRFVGVPEECLGCDGKTVAGVLTEVRERATAAAVGVAATAAVAAAAAGVAAEESLEERVQRRKMSRTFSRTKGDRPSSIVGGIVTANVVPPSTTPAGPRPDPAAKSQTSTGNHKTGSERQEKQSASLHVEDPNIMESKAGGPRRAISVGHRRSFNFLQSFLHRSSPAGGQDMIKE